MKKLGKIFTKLLRDERGLETVEYAVIAALISIAAIAAITLVGTNVAAKFNNLASKIGP